MSANSTFTEIVTTTLRDHPGKIHDNVSDHNALYRRIKDKGRLRRESDGGYEIICNLDYAENGTFQRYSGYDALDISASDVLSAAQYSWVQSAISVTASGLELRKNAGKNRLANLMRARLRNATRTAANNMSVDLYGTGALSNQMGGLGHIITSDGTGSVGGINSSTYAFWANQYQEAAGTGPSYTDLKKDMTTLWLACTRGMDKPDLILSTNDLWVHYWDQLSDVQRYTSNSTPDTFDSLKFMGADVVHDTNDNFSATGEVMYFINSDYLELVEHADAAWTPLEQVRSVNQDASVVTMIWQGQLTCSNRARQGKLIDVS